MFEINGQSLLQCPTSFRWIDRESVGIDGSGRNTYEPNRSFELAWNLLTMAQFNQLCGFYEDVANTGTVSIVLPQHCADLWTGVAYDAKLDEPTSEGFWYPYHQNVKLIARDIIT